ncbi:MAG: hypothetical protein OK422_03400 [Thaumarchaeota archaeon]|nr:hypothetical protein [Nitrososphaerota archaeon]
MYDFDTLVDEVLRSKPNLDKDDLMQRIKDKKNTVGSGYLTDQGALFLIAGELGVRLDHMTSADLTLKDLYVGANDMTVVARVLAIYPVTEYNKKDGGKGRYRRLLLFDGGNLVRMTMWDEKVEEIEKLGIKVDAPIRVVSGYVKQGLDGKPNLNLGKRGSLERIQDEEVASKLTSLDDLVVAIEKLKDEQQILALEASVSSETRSSNFTRADGTAGSLTQFRVEDKEGRGERRVVIWSPAGIPELKQGQRVKITNLRVKVSSRGESELHGDAGTVVLFSKEKKDGREFRVATVSSEGRNLRFLVVDSEKKVSEVNLEGQAAETAKGVKPGDLVLITPDNEARGVMMCRTAASLLLATSAVGTPALDLLGVKINELRNISWPIMVEAIALSSGIVQDAHLKDGSVVKKGELVIGDDTSEIKLIGWREQGAKVLGVEPGQRVRVVGATPQESKVGVTTLQLSYFSRIEKLRGR